MKLVIGLVLCLLGVRIAKSQDNLAHGKPTVQSSTFDNEVSSNAVDGNTSSCSRTQSGGFQVLSVNLGEEYLIGEIVIYYSPMDSSERLQNTEVFVYPSTVPSNPVDHLCSNITTSTSNVSKEVIQCRGLYGQFVVISKTDNKSLSLCEIEVFQHNLAHGKPTVQSSTFDNEVSSNAVDGNTSSCSRTQNGGSQFWLVDLEEEYVIGEIVIYYNPMDSSERLQNTDIYIPPKNRSLGLDSLCGRITTSTSNVSKEVIQCRGLYGQNVFILRTDGQPLTLCEVEVFQRPNRDCGTPAIPPFQGNTRIIGGQAANPGSWPWMVQAIYNGVFLCGGSLISDRWIVSAAHCINGFNDDDDLSNWKMAIGSYNRDQVDEGEVRADVDLIIMHDDFDALTFNNDIALIRLAQPVTFNDRVSAVCLPERSVRVGTSCYVTGWGETQGTGSDDVLKQAYVPVISNVECIMKYLSPYRAVGNNMICAGYDEGGIDACQGDSGGPLVCQEPGGSWEIQGIVSSGEGCGEPNQPGIYTRVTQYTAWILNQTALHQ